MTDEQRERKNQKRLLALAAVAGLVLAVSLVLAFAQRPRRVKTETREQQQATDKREQQSSNRKGAAARTVRAGEDLQRALDAASPGDTILLEAGATFRGSFTLPYKPGTNTDADWITIRSAAPDSSLPPAGTRITPAYSQALPKIVSANYKGLDYGGPALKTAPRAHHYRVIGVEFAPADRSADLYDLITLGDGSDAQKSLDAVPHHLVLDRCYIHAYGDAPLKRGVALNSAQTEILNSHISGAKKLDQDTQAVAGWNGPGPFKIINNYLEAAGENIMFGGGQPSIPDLVPSDIEIRRNLVSKPLAWRKGGPGFAGQAWSVKNLLQLKNARRVNIDGNVFENCWLSGQDGWAILFTVYNENGHYAVVEDVRLTNNVVRHAAGGITIRGLDVLPGAHVRRVMIKNNLFEDIDGKYGEAYGRFMMILRGTIELTVEHNTVMNTGAPIFADGEPHMAFVFRNNIINLRGSGVFGQGRSPGTDSISYYFPGADFRHNVMIGQTDEPYPANNFNPRSAEAVGFVDPARRDFRLGPGSRFKGAATDNKDVGCDFDRLEAALNQGDARGQLRTADARREGQLSAATLFP
ncbi:MAG TPA: hypothetical protein VF507_08565 [Pyrinomonadaceae bacterium]|jgi:hypothetical protein